MNIVLALLLLAIISLLPIRLFSVFFGARNTRFFIVFLAYFLGVFIGYLEDAVVSNETVAIVLNIASNVLIFSYILGASLIRSFLIFMLSTIVSIIILVLCLKLFILFGANDLMMRMSSGFEQIKHVAKIITYL